MEQRLSFHQQLRLERERRGWSQANLAERMGDISVKTIRRWERGESLPQPYYRQKFIEVFGKSPEELDLIVQPEQEVERSPHKEDWGEAPLGNPFYGREGEQARLQAWLTERALSCYCSGWYWWHWENVIGCKNGVSREG